MGFKFRTYLLAICFMCIFIVLLFWIYSTSTIKNCNTKLTAKYDSNFEDNLIILYNRVPKTGSTSFMSLLYALQSVNKFSVAYVNVSWISHRFLFLDQYRFALNVTSWNIRKPAIYSGHFPFLDFTKLGMHQPLYINIVRKPLDRAVSHYYFIRYGDTYLPNKKRLRHGDETSFDDCVKLNSSECSEAKLWMQIPYFCGSDAFCWEPGSEKALLHAKINLEKHYFLVGLMEKMDSFIEILESILPRFFHGSLKLFLKDGQVQLRKTKIKKSLLPQTVEHFKKSKVWQMEEDFYQFVKKHFDTTYQEFIHSRTETQFSFSKLKPEFI
ncbi:heparin sulfate O-sulfotransferase [Hydra vulgaris]|uniref:Heparin sulfate O-sulfotransferase n=1 Tax=Hydra vulgaris TaxID=6087 RepID=A0ABM4D5A9_HYDVU